ncbi:metalloproteinase domain-containing protein [Bdellovibrio bacteriovorus]|uniref:metalloproteinase domain-containing protein n=1 Tax=Bdellovibrio bacteriovorus TaxID=959 RepID=UPI003CFE95DC
MRVSISVLLMSFVFSTQAFASAFDSLNDQKLQEQALTLLEQNAASMRLTGDVRAEEKLTEILAKVQAYNDEILTRLSEGQDLESMTSAVSHTDTKCSIDQGGKSAVCNLLITYRLLGETNVRFHVDLDDAGNAVGISNTADITRGD